MASQTNPIVDNEHFLLNVGYLAAISNKGPFRNVNLNARINNFQAIDNVADIIAGDDADTGNRRGKVVSNILAGSVRTIKVQFLDLPQPAGMPNAEYVSNYKNQIVDYVIAKTATGQTSNVKQHNPWLTLSQIGCVFSRPLVAIQGTNPEFELEGAPITIQQGGPATSVDLNIAGASVQKKVAGVNSGSPVVANGSGVASIPNGNTTGQVITFEVSKVGYNTKVFGPYTVLAP